MADKVNETAISEKHPNGRCFVMMPISNQGDYPDGHFDKVYNQIFRPAIIKAGYEPYRVDENTISDSIINKIFEAIQNCEMALCDLSNRNPNVLYELGLRQAYNKPVVLVMDEKTERIFDISVLSTVPYESNRLYENVIEAQNNISNALNSTREGKSTSLVQYVRATEAKYSDVSVNGQDTIDIMLQSIMNEIRDLKYNSKSNISRRERDLRANCYIKNIEYEVINNPELSKVEIESNIQGMLKKFNVKRVRFSEDEERSNITIDIDMIDYMRFKEEIENYIFDKVGKIAKKTQG